MLQVLAEDKPRAFSVVAISPDDTTIAGATRDFAVRLWDAKNGKLIHAFAGHTQPLASVEFSPDGKILASSSEDSTIKLWDIENRRLSENIVGRKAGNWFWEDKQSKVFWRGDDGSLLLQSGENYIPLPPSGIGDKDYLSVAILSSDKVTLVDGAVTNLEIEVTSNGDQSAWWISALQPDQSNFYFRSAQIYHLETGKTRTLKIPTGARMLGIIEPREEIMAFELESATKDRFKVSVPVRVMPASSKLSPYTGESITKREKSNNATTSKPQSAEPLIVQAPQQWKLKYHGDGLKKHQYTLTRTETPGTFLLFSRWPNQASAEMIPVYLDIMKNTLYPQSRNNKTSNAFKVKSIGGLYFSGKYVPVLLTQEGYSQIIFAFNDEENNWKGQFTGSKEYWEEALSILKKLKKTDQMSRQ